MMHSSSVESRFLKLCLCARWDAAALEAARALARQDNLDWGVVWQVAQSEGVAPLVYHTTRHRQLLPAALEGALRQAYYQNAVRNLRLLHRLEMVLNQLTSVGVPVMVLKGAALAEGIYPNPSLRPMGDVDLLVRHEDVERALSSLAELGYVPHMHLFADGYVPAYTNQVALATPGGCQETIEIHWSLFSRTYYYLRVPMEWFWRSAREVQFGPVSARVLSPEAQLLHLCAHILQHGGADSVPWRSLHDVSEVVALYRAQLDWDLVLTRAREYRLELSVRHVLEEVHAEWSAPVPAQVLDRLRALRPSLEEEQVFGRLTNAHRPVQRLWADLADSPDWKSRWGVWRSRALPSAQYIREHYGVPSQALVPFYYLYRWLRSLRRE